MAWPNSGDQLVRWDASIRIIRMLPIAFGFISESFLRKHIWTSNFPMPFWSGKIFASLFHLKATKATLCSAKNACPWPAFAASSPSHLYSCGTRRGSTSLHRTRLRPPPWRAAAVVGRGNCPGGRQRGPRAAQCQRHGDPEARDASQALWICMPGEWDAGGQPKKEMMMGKMEPSFLFWVD